MEWISVKDRLPEKTTVVITAHIKDPLPDDGKHYQVETALFLKDDNRFHCTYSLNTLNVTIQLYLHKVTHWMPLPEPPQT